MKNSMKLKLKLKCYVRLGCSIFENWLFAGMKDGSWMNSFYNSVE